MSEENFSFEQEFSCEKEFDMSDELERLNVQYENEHRDQIKISIVR
jgi:hypothetical protein